MNDYIGYCGLDCEKCEARLATVNNDENLRKKVAELWSQLNGTEITPEMINCTGCRIEGPKYPYCESMCPIKQCALDRKHSTCADCSKMNLCEKLRSITDYAYQCRVNLLRIKGISGEREKLIDVIDKLHTTDRGAERIRKNIGLREEDPVAWCRNKILDDEVMVTRQGKNWYVRSFRCIITVNADNCNIITAHKE